MSAPELPFLARRSFRRKRLADAARLMPFAGAVLLLMPVLWRGAVPGEGPSTVAAFVYIFGAWAGLIAVSAALAFVLAGEEEAEDAAEGGEGGAGTEAD